MEPFTIKNGRVIRSVDNQLLRTKVIASIGNPMRYEDGITLLNGEVRPKERITHDFLVNEFYDNGVDIVRMNASEPSASELRSTFSKIRAAIIKREGRQKARKRLAVLIDLPGPKIRFHLVKDMAFSIGQTLKIHFLKNVQKRSEVTIFVNDKPLGEALQEVDQSRLRVPAIADEDSTITSHDSYGKFLSQLRQVASSQSGLRVVLGDGDVFMDVGRDEINDVEGSIVCTVAAVKSRRFKQKPGCTLRDVDLDIPSFTKEDENKLAAIIEADYSSSEHERVAAFFGLSFTQSADDVLRARRFLETKLAEVWKGQLNARLHAPSIIAKIETKKGMKNRKFILDIADGIMVARGDLGLQMNLEEVPENQKKLIGLCNKRGKPVITATEMLKSMTGSMEPTRAEVTDVFDAIMDGSDAVMMSGETSSGKFPFHSIRKMISIAAKAERYHEYRGVEDDNSRRTKCLDRIEDFLKDDIRRIQGNNTRFTDCMDHVDREIRSCRVKKSKAIKNIIAELEWRRDLYEEKWSKTQMQIATNLITQAACKMAEGEGIMCILAASTSGRTVRMLSRLRPSVTIVGAAHDPMNTRKLVLSYGVLPICIDEVRRRDGPEKLFRLCKLMITSDLELKSLLLQSRRHKATQTVIFTAGTPLLEPGTTNLIQSRELDIPEG